ncbi:hypothetical protein RHS04_00059 [Rhizoctonia solani]|uniref:Uncharacterized protein n=1 Tax=Rhizoctonia solani TaxID=456999 RepID=A0A8H7LPD5_9AGAM|nr:hypothetical protein RHS04_00059 [Rhizoctonia solani]
MSSTALEPPLSLRRRTNQLEAAHAMSKFNLSRLPSPPEDGDSSDDTVIPTGREGYHSNGDSSHKHASGSGSSVGGMSSGGGANNQFAGGSGIAGETSRPYIPFPRHVPSTPESLAQGKDSSSDSDSSQDLGFSETAHHIANSNTWSDLPLLITLVPPAFALFTGGDYVRDVLLTCLIVWYLYQLIKIPWDIYLASLPVHHRQHEAGPSSAQKELRTTRIFALLLCVITPFLGATLLRLSASLLYPDSLSWFSTSLFVLAAGVRPWRHLAHLVLTRTDALHLAAHRPSAFRSALLAPGAEAEVRHREREKDSRRVAELEGQVRQLQGEMNILHERFKRMAKHVQTADSQVAQLSARLETLERYGANASVSGVELVWKGARKVVKGLVCGIFPFMEKWFEGTQVDVSRGRGGKGTSRGNKGKRSRGVVHNLPPVLEVDEAKAASGDARVPPAHIKREHPTSSVSWAATGVDVATWPVRAMRAIATGWFRVLRS